MATNSFKLICPKCFRSVRATRADIYVICGYCNHRMNPVSSHDCRRPDSHSEMPLSEESGAVHE